MNSKRLLQSGIFILGLMLSLSSIGQRKNNQAQIQDTPFIQEYSIKYNFNNDRVELRQVAADRNGYVQVLSSHGLLRPKAGQFLFPRRTGAGCAVFANVG